MHTPSTLKAKQRELRDRFPESLGLRVHRSISWLMRAEHAGDDPDVQFVLLWVGFNACYSENDRLPAREKQVFDGYFKKILKFDKDDVVADAIWSRFSGPIRILLDNKYVFQPYWNRLHSVDDSWKSSFDAAKRLTNIALKHGDTHTILSILFDRLYVLRNQLVHGGATWNSQLNRDQMRDGCAILTFLLPCFIDIMMEHPHESWGEPCYPVVKD